MNNPNGADATWPIKNSEQLEHINEEMRDYVRQSNANMLQLHERIRQLTLERDRLQTELHEVEINRRYWQNLAERAGLCDPPNQTPV